MGGAPKNTTQTTKVELSPEQKKILQTAMPYIEQYGKNPLEQYGGSQISPFDPLQTQGQEMALNAAGQQQQTADQASAASKFLLSDVLSPDSNPYLKQYIDAATRPINEQLTQGTLPSIRGEANTSGQFGSSRQGIAEGLAAQGASRAVGDTTANIATTAYGQGLDAQGRALALAPQTQAMQAQSAITTSGVGDVRRNMDQARLTEEITRFYNEQMLPYIQGSQLAGLVGAIPGGGSTTTASGASSNPLMGGLGGAASGAALGSAIMPGVGTGIGALLGGMGGLFM